MTPKHDEARMRCLPAHAGVEFRDDTPPWLSELLTEYLSHFYRPKHRDDKPSTMMLGTHECVNCGEILDGLLLGTFTWDIAHGEFRCGKCGWPGRAYHRVYRDGEDEAVLEFGGPNAGALLLQYHGDDVSGPQPAAEQMEIPGG